MSTVLADPCTAAVFTEVLTQTVLASLARARKNKSGRFWIVVREHLSQSASNTQLKPRSAASLVHHANDLDVARERSCIFEPSRP